MLLQEAISADKKVASCLSKIDKSQRKQADAQRQIEKNRLLADATRPVEVRNLLQHRTLVCGVWLRF